ncbi:hypothetical protein HanRHA438_Chr03g0112011 [Helianthus annuus]|nr:hypothetical protein HanHA300_Chr03g0084071 [Helianthus annuus]KAJ0599886.1 hypothetical protein HanIR_Chr03g0110211 [Helianthus annuus]KAJ0607341.1 hypothetical protein HanHA89_Chr03g0095581 [Helianthus annuus]KAJ0767396.1 hypothetical protein HanLR1_Chr03g0088841 [Helianthus annuus]KAJ0773237.1 hypothetical protein HanOQP8_Chr03g0096831 [Helianthus annuus]
MYDRLRVGAVAGGTYPEGNVCRFHEIVGAVGCERRKVLFGVTRNDATVVVVMEEISQQVFWPEDLRRPFGHFGPLKDIYLPRDYYSGGYKEQFDALKEKVVFGTDMGTERLGMEAIKAEMGGFEILNWGEDRRFNEMRSNFGKLAVFWIFQAIRVWTLDILGFHCLSGSLPSWVKAAFYLSFNCIIEIFLKKKHWAGSPCKPQICCSLNQDRNPSCKS